MKKTYFILLINLILILNLFAGCNSTPKKEKFTDYSFDYFDTATSIVGYEKTREEFDAVCVDIKHKLEEYHRLYTIYNSYDNLNNMRTVNSQKNSVSVDKKIIDMLLFSKEMYSNTNGKFNIAMGSVLSVWHDYREEGMLDPKSAKLPPMEVLQSAADHTDINKILIDTDNNTVTLQDDKMSLDVGAVAKGYAVEQVAQWMESKGISGYILNVGGNVRTVGKRPDGTSWTVGIENPDKSDSEKEYIAYLSISDMAVVTSGSYQRFYTVNGINYHHIIDPNTLMPSENFISVSVLSPDSGKADILSTALFSMNYNEGKELIESMPDTEAMWVMPDGEQLFSSGFKKFCVNLD